MCYKEISLNYWSMKPRDPESLIRCIRAYVLSKVNEDNIANKSIYYYIYYSYILLTIPFV